MEQIFHVSTNCLIVIMFKCSMAVQMKAYHDSNHFRVGELSRMVAVFFVALKLAAFDFGDFSGKFS